MRIAIDIDSTLHEYWDQFRSVARRRFAVDLRYEDQLTWGVTQLRPEQTAELVRETHLPHNVLAAVPYPGAVEVVRSWHEQGHYIHITSHRAHAAHAATAQWLERIGLPCDDLHCSYDKIARCSELGIELLIDDSPVNIERALAAGIGVATIVHPWNRELCEAHDVVSAPDWPTLARRLEPLLSGRRAA